MATSSIDVTLELLSPCFLGGAYQEPEFRIASLRGIWRYWYRALHGRGDETQPSDEEAAIFGNTEGRGLSRLAPLEAPSAIRGSAGAWPRPQAGPGSGADYLLYTMGMNGRSYLEPDQRIRLRLSVDRVPVDASVRSLAAACAFSGLGARSRRMAGAITVLGSAPDCALLPEGRAATTEDVASRLSALIEPARGRTVAVAAYPIVAKDRFSAGVVRQSFTRWREALDATGSAMRTFRLRRQPDYDIAKRALQGQAPGPDQAIRRAAFGLPMQFRFRATTGALHVRLPESDRRGSPLFLTLERLSDDRLAVVWCLFRSQLTPGSRMTVGRAQTKAPDLSIVDEMLAQPFWASHRIA